MSLLFLTLAVIGGIASWSGALLGAAMFTLLAPILSQPVFVQNVVFKNVFGGQLPTLLPVFFGLGAIEQTREGFADFRRRLESRAASGAAAAPVKPAASTSSDALVTFTRATTYHREACVLATGKEAVPVTAAKLRQLSACSLCSPAATDAAAAPTRRRQPLRAR